MLSSERHKKQSYNGKEATKLRKRIFTQNSCGNSTSIKGNKTKAIPTNLQCSWRPWTVKGFNYNYDA